MFYYRGECPSIKRIITMYFSPAKNYPEIIGLGYKCTGSKADNFCQGCPYIDLFKEKAKSIL